MATKTLSERYEEAAAKFRDTPSASNRKTYHSLRDELVEQTREARAAQPGGAVTADRVEEV